MVRAGGTLLTSVGQLAIEGVDAVTLRDLTESDAVAAGFADVGELTAALSGRQEGTPYRVRLRLAGPDPRIALRAALPAADELRGMLDRLDRWDSSSITGPWTWSAMGVIARRPGVRAGDLAAEIEMERARFKSHVRKLKGLGLTESLEVGYRLSPRGEAVFAASEGDGTEHRSTPNR